MKKTVSKFIDLMPWILGFLFVLFLMVFSLDVIEPGVTPWQIFSGLIIHNIPVFILIIILIISRRYEIVGGITFVLLGIFFIAINVIGNIYDPWYISLLISLIVAVPSFLIGILFMRKWRIKKRLNLV